MTGKEYRLTKEEEKRRQEIVYRIMTKYHLTEQDALRYYFERIYRKNE